MGEYFDSSRKTHSFLDTGGSFTAFDAPGANGRTAAYGINDGGQIVGNFDKGEGGQIFAFLYSDGRFTTIDVPGAAFNFAYGVNDSGQIVGSSVPGGSSEFGFLATPLVVPEPRTLTVLAICLIGLCAMTCRVKRA